MKLKLIIILAALFLISCSDDISRGEYMDNLKDFSPLGDTKCKSHGQEFLLIYTDNLRDYEVLCITKSPFSMYRYDLVKIR